MSMPLHPLETPLERKTYLEEEAAWERENEIPSNTKQTEDPKWEEMLKEIGEK